MSIYVGPNYEPNIFGEKLKEASHETQLQVMREWFCNNFDDPTDI